MCEFFSNIEFGLKKYNCVQSNFFSQREAILFN